MMKLSNISAILLLMAGMCFAGCSNDDDFTASTTPLVTSVTTGDAVLTATSADIKDGTVQSLKGVSASSFEVGVVYSTSGNPTEGGTKVVGTWADDMIQAHIGGLTTGTTYYYASYVLLQNKVYRYGEVKSFTTMQIAVTTPDAANVSYTKATISPTFSGLEGADGATTGLKIGRSNDANVLLRCRDYSLGKVEGLLPGTTYYYMPYVKVGSGYVLGEIKTFTTKTQAMQYVDLGLSVMWAACNIGAEEEEGVGTYYGYGDQTGELLSVDLADYPSVDISDTEFDVTNGILIDGTSQMLSAMPTVEQVNELIDNTIQTRETVNGVEGVRFTARNGNSIFLPCTGYREGRDIAGATTETSYWTGSVSKVNASYASTLTFRGNGEVATGNMLRYYGLPIRTVRAYE